MRRRVFAVAVLTVMSILTNGARAQTPTYAGTRWEGLEGGPYGVGFQSRSSLDSTRVISESSAGTPLGLAIWYPTPPGAAESPAMSQLDYRLLQFMSPLEEPARRRFEDGEIATSMGWRHVGLVELTAGQARASLHARGKAWRNAPAAPGRFPVVLVLGGPHYLATTAELLASHGFIVASAFRFQDQSNEIGTDQFSWYLENSARDAEWVLDELRRDERADLRSVSVIGHGGGGAQALLVAMRNRLVTAVVNLDAGNFSARSGLRTIPFYSPRLMRAPYLYIATTSTRETQDQFEDFLAMKFSARVEVTLSDPDLRHHDFSDFGRAITAPLGIRGPAQAIVARRYADVHEMVVRFLKAHSGSSSAPRVQPESSLAASTGSDRPLIIVHPATAPAPTVASVLGRFGADTLDELRAARERDPEAPLFQVDALQKVVTHAVTSANVTLAAALADFATVVHPRSVPLQALKSEALEARGDLNAARAVAAACAAMTATGDWRAGIAVDECRARAERLAQRR